MTAPTAPTMPRNPFLEHLNVTDQPVGKDRAKPCLADPEHEPHDRGKHQNAGDGVQENLVGRVGLVDLGGLGLALFDLRDDVVDELIALAVFLVDCVLVVQVDVRLQVRRLLRRAGEGDGLLHDLGETLVLNRGRAHDGAAELLFQRGHVNRGLFLLVDVGLVQRDDHGDAELKQLRGEKQAAAQIRRVHDVDDRVRMLVADILARDALLRRERGHGVSARQVDRDGLGAVRKLTLDRVLLASYRNAAPVAHFFTSAGDGVVNRGFAAVGVAGKSNSHYRLPPLLMRLTGNEHVPPHSSPFGRFSLCCPRLLPDLQGI